MEILPTLYNNVFSRYNTIILVVSILATLGTATVLGAGVWDSISHALRIPDTFWTIQHTVIYTGASLIATSAVLGTLVSVKNKKLNKGILLVLIGAVLQLGGGYADYNFHEVYGIDGLVTPSHLTVESGLFMSAMGGLLLISKVKHDELKLIIPVSILTVLLSASWIGFNLVLLVGGIELCIPIYELFSSGCAVM
jgi:hypothetical protein